MSCQTQSSGDVHIVSAWYRKSSHFWDLLWTRTDRQPEVESSWNVMVHGDAREGKWRGNWGMEWVTSTLHTTSEHGVSSITTADAHTSAASIRQNWHPRRSKWTRPFRRKTKSGFCGCAITFQLACTIQRSICTYSSNYLLLKLHRTADQDSFLHYGPTYHAQSLFFSTVYNQYRPKICGLIN